MRDPVLDELFRETEHSGKDTDVKSRKLGKKVKAIKAMPLMNRQPLPETAGFAAAKGSKDD